MLIKAERRSIRHRRELKKLQKQCESQNNLRLWKRVKAILMYLNQRTPKEVADLLDAGLKSIYRWLSGYNTYGVDGLLEGKHPGRPSLLRKEQLEALEDIMDSGPVAYGLTTGIWTCPTVRYVIEEEFGVRYHHDHVRKILHELGFSVQRPKKTLALADSKLQQKWVRKTYPGLKKSANKSGE